MIVKGKYLLSAANDDLAELETDASMHGTFTAFVDGIRYTFNKMRLTGYSTSWSVSYYSPIVIPPDGGIQVFISSSTPGGDTHYYRPEARVVDFGDVEQTITFGDSVAEQMFSLLFIPLAEDEFVNELNLAKVTNKILDQMYVETVDQIAALKPVVTTVHNNNSATTNPNLGSYDLSDYDLVFLRANAYNTYTPLCQTFPAKLMCEAVRGGAESFDITFSDNAAWTTFTVSRGPDTNGKPNYYIGKSGSSNTSRPGVIKQLYGVKLPEVK